MQGIKSSLFATSYGCFVVVAVVVHIVVAVVVAGVACVVVFIAVARVGSKRVRHSCGLPL